MDRSATSPAQAFSRSIGSVLTRLRAAERRASWSSATQVATTTDFSTITTGGYLPNELVNGGSWPNGTEALSFNLDPGRWVLYGMFNYSTELGAAATFFNVGLKISWQAGVASGSRFVYGGGNQARYGVGLPVQIQTVSMALEVLAEEEISVAARLVSGVQSLGGDDAQTTPLYLSLISYPG